MNATMQNVATPNRANVRSIKNLAARETLSSMLSLGLPVLLLPLWLLIGVPAVIGMHYDETSVMVLFQVVVTTFVVIVISVVAGAYSNKQSGLIQYFHEEVMTGMIVEMPVMNTTYSILMLTVVVEGLNRAGNTVREDIPIDAEKWREGEYIIGQQFIRPGEFKLAD